ncbi:uncharacterized protein LOC129585869 [Paramacrobiotus metropolitanus]|uniref:uncharacterized protein LOC129585869 n=1 Tax=Paramacrobiotus metropolitanus TaxID=2943436 RepID=UPI0024462BCD|nr:uncharacterized protein LOC129585869 [Paramacrobiotus metropolitanus]
MANSLTPSTNTERRKTVNSEADMQTDPDEKRGVNMMRIEHIVKKFPNYEDFLNSQINETDMYYLEDRGIARTIKELGFHNNAEKVTREQFASKKTEQAMVKKIEEHKSGAKYLHTDRDVFLLELARREEANLNGRLVTIIYLRDRNAKGQEISSYIDYAQRLREEDFAEIFAGRERLVAKATDISHFNWDTNVTHSNNTRNFDVIYQGPEGLQLKCRKDRRIIHVNPSRKIKNPNLEDTSRTVLRSRNHAQVVLFDHFIRFWAKDDDPDADTTPETLPTFDGITDTKLNLYDAVTAAIYEDDLLEIAKNALGGHLHQEHHGQWAPADLITSSKPGETNVIPESSSQPLETSVLSTIRELYDAHKNDLSYGTLGNFTFMQLIEQLGHLLPPEARKQCNKEIDQIASDTAFSKGPAAETLPRVVADPDTLMDAQAKKISQMSDDDNLQVNGVSNDRDAFILPASRIETVSSELFRDRQVDQLFDSDFHNQKLKDLLAKSNTTGEVTKTTYTQIQFEEEKEGVRNSSSVAQAKPGVANVSNNGEKHDPVEGPYKSLEKQMIDRFKKKTRTHTDALPAYPQPVKLGAPDRPDS